MDIRTEFPACRKAVIQSPSKFGKIVIFPCNDDVKLLNLLPPNINGIENGAYFSFKIGDKQYNAKFIGYIKTDDEGKEESIKDIYVLDKDSFKEAFEMKTKGGSSGIKIDAIYLLMNDNDQLYAVGDANFDTQFFLYRLDNINDGRMKSIVDDLRKASQKPSSVIETAKLEASKKSRSVKRPSMSKKHASIRLNKTHTYGGDKEAISKGIDGIEKYYKEIGKTNGVDPNTYEMRDYFYGVYVEDPDKLPNMIKLAPSPDEYVTSLHTIKDNNKYEIDSNSEVIEVSKPSAPIIEETNDGIKTFKLGCAVDSSVKGGDDEESSDSSSLDLSSDSSDSESDSYESDMMYGGSKHKKIYRHFRN